MLALGAKDDGLRRHSSENQYMLFFHIHSRAWHTFGFCDPSWQQQYCLSHHTASYSTHNFPSRRGGTWCKIKEAIADSR